MDTPRRLRMFAGPNGSGKSTLVQTLAREFSPDGLFSLHHYLNADDLLKELPAGVSLAKFGVTPNWSELAEWLQLQGRVTADHAFFGAASLEDNLVKAPADVCDSYVAAAIVDFLRERLLESRKSFSFETVMSHPSKVEFFCRAQSLGFRTYLYFVATENPEINLSRIGYRTSTGGHFVPEKKVFERYERSLDLLPSAIRCANRAFLFDNSQLQPKWIAEKENGTLVRTLVSDAQLPGLVSPRNEAHGVGT